MKTFAKIFNVLRCKGVNISEKTDVEKTKSEKSTSHAESSEKKPTLTPRKIKILVSVIYGNLFLGSCCSLLAPFFPDEAERKGASATEYGLIFGIYSLVCGLASPVHGKLVARLTPGCLMKVGMTVSGICSIVFGTLTMLPDGIPFVACSFTVRIIDALGASAFLTASYTIIGCEFPHNIGRAMSAVETAYSVGLAVGPVIGGLLYEYGGFIVPFAVIGTLLLSGTLVNFFLFSDVEKMEKVKPGSAKKIISNYDFLLDIIVMVVCFMTLGFNEATLEPHLRQFLLSPKATGGMFLISGSVDAVASFLWGYFAEKFENAQVLALMPCFIFTLCFLIVGPAPFFGFPTLLSVVIISQVLFGLAMSGEIMCSFTHGIKHTIERGFPDSVATYGMVSGLLYSAACIGGFIGPAAGGFLIDNIGYSYSTLFISALQTLLGLMIASRLAYKSTCTPKSNISKRGEQDQSNGA